MNLKGFYKDEIVSGREAHRIATESMDLAIDAFKQKWHFTPKKCHLEYYDYNIEREVHEVDEDYTQVNYYIILKYKTIPIVHKPILHVSIRVAVFPHCNPRNADVCIFWSDEEDDIKVHWKAGSKRMGLEMLHHVYSQESKIKEEIQNRGYDPKTLRFEISKKK